MKRILLILVFLTTSYAFSQQKTFESEVKRISKNIDRITQQEKDSLKIKVKKIDDLLESGQITFDEAKKQKRAAAQYHATKIENRVGAEERKLQQLVQDKTNGRIASIPDDEIEYSDDNTFTVGGKRFKLSIGNDKDHKKPVTRKQRIQKGLHPRTGEPFKNERQKKRFERELKRSYSKITTSHFIFSMGVNNVLVNNDLNSLENSDYGFWNSHMYELGWTWKSRFTRKPSKLYFKYGVSFLWNNLRAENNQYHVKNATLTELQVHPNSLIESRLRHTQVIFPIGIEFDFTRDRFYTSGRQSDRRNKSFRIGFGGFAGFKMGTRQYLEYVNSDGVKVVETIKDNYNTNILNYGLAANVGFGSTSVFAKYDLNPLFKDTEIRNISFGVRLEL